MKAVEGTTQGDPAASGWYALSTIPIIQHLKSIRDCKMHQAWFADDSSVGGKLSCLRRSWDELERIGPGYGYLPNARKTVLIVNKQFVEEAKARFGNAGVIITTEGQRHLGAVVGSQCFREQYVKELVEGWVKEVETLAEYAASEYTSGATSNMYKPLEDSIRNKLIPALTGQSCSDLERESCSLYLADLAA